MTQRVCARNATYFLSSRNCSCIETRIRRANVRNNTTMEWLITENPGKIPRECKLSRVRDLRPFRRDTRQRWFGAIYFLSFLLHFLCFGLDKTTNDSRFRGKVFVVVATALFVVPARKCITSFPPLFSNYSQTPIISSSSVRDESRWSIDGSPRAIDSTLCSRRTPS